MELRFQGRSGYYIEREKHDEAVQVQARTTTTSTTSIILEVLSLVCGLECPFIHYFSKPPVFTIIVEYIEIRLRLIRCALSSVEAIPS